MKSECIQPFFVRITAQYGGIAGCLAMLGGKRF